MRRGDSDAREALICANLRFAMKVAAKYRGMVKDHSDIVQAANMGLILAVDKYPPSYRMRLISYARFWIQQMITQAITSERGMIHVSSGVGVKLRAALRAGYDGKDDGVPACVAQAASVQSVVSLDAPGLFTTVRKMSAPARTSSPQVGAAQAETAQITARYLSRLTQRQRFVLSYRHGISGAEPMTYRDIGRRLGISHERVRQIHDKALRDCRKLMALDRIDAEVEALIREIENAA
jgi:RNA polymerase primary sigma factor